MDFRIKRRWLDLDLALMRFDTCLEELVAGFVIEFRRGP